MKYERGPRVGAAKRNRRPTRSQTIAVRRLNFRRELRLNFYAPFAARHSALGLTCRMVSGCGCSENAAAGTKLWSAVGDKALDAAAAGCKAMSCGAAAEAVAAAAAAAALGSAWYGCWTGNGTATNFWKGSAHGSVTHAPFGWWCISAESSVEFAGTPTATSTRPGHVHHKDGPSARRGFNLGARARFQLYSPYRVSARAERWPRILQIDGTIRPRSRTLYERRNRTTRKSACKYIYE